MVFGIPSFSYKSLPGNPRKWVSAKVSKLRERKANEVTQLKPIALAGASRGFSGRSQLCNSFARTQVQRAAPSKLESKKPSSDDTLSEGDEDEDNNNSNNDDADAEGTSSSRSATAQSWRHQENYYRRAVNEGQWKSCEMCSRQFLRSDSKFAAFCSLDCKSAAYLGAGAYQY